MSDANQTGEVEGGEWSTDSLAQASERARKLRARELREAEVASQELVHSPTSHLCRALRDMLAALEPLAPRERERVIRAARVLLNLDGGGDGR